MREVILHIGMHKTGTTSFQDSAAEYDDGVTRYARLGDANHSVAMTTIFSRNPAAYHIWASQGLTKEMVERRRGYFRALLDAQVAAADRERLVISGEDISSLAPVERDDLLDYFIDRGVDVKVVCVVREPASFIASLLPQLVRGGLPTLSTLPVAYRPALRRFYRRLPRRALIVRDYHELIAAHGDIVAALARICRLRRRYVTPVRSNEALSALATKLLLRLNRLPLGASGNTQQTRARTIAAIAGAFPIGDGAGRIDPRALDGLFKTDQDDLDFLKRRFRIAYTHVPVGRNARASRAYFADLEGLTADTLRTRLHAAGVAAPLRGGTIDRVLAALYDSFRAPSPANASG